MKIKFKKRSKFFLCITDKLVGNVGLVGQSFLLIVASVCCFFTIHQANSQQNEPHVSYFSKVIDSLKIELETANTVKHQIDVYTDLGKLYVYENVDSAYAIGDRIVELSIFNGFKEGEYRGNVIKAYANVFKGDFDASKKESRNIIDNSLDDVNRYLAYHILASCNNIEHNYLEALKGYRNALRISSEIDDAYSEVIIHINIGGIYHHLEQYDDALKHFAQALQLIPKTSYKYVEAIILFEIGFNYYYQKSYDKSIDYLEKALIAAKKYSFLHVTVYSKNLLAKVYFEKKEYSKALDLNTDAFEVFDSMAFNPLMATVINTTQAKLFFAQKDYEQALQYANASLNYGLSIRSIDQLSEVTNLLYKIYRVRENYPEMNKYLDMHQSYLDTTFMEKFDPGILGEVLELEQENFELSKNKELSETKARSLFYILGLLVTLLIIIAVLQFFQNRRLKQVNNLKSDFLNSISTELTKPVKKIVGLTTLLDKSIKDDNSTYVNEIDMASKDLLRKFSNMLKLSSYQKKEVLLSPTPSNLFQLGQQLVDKFKPMANEKGLSFEVNISKFLKPLTVSCDTEKLEQVIIVLIGNAIKFTNQGSIGLQIKYVGYKSGELEVDFVITDTGVGIGKKDLDRIFLTFFKAQNEVNRKQDGLGVGLTMVQSLMDLMQTEIQVKSTLEVGSTFFFRLAIPILELDNLEQRGNPKLLIIEDNQASMTLLTNMIKEKYPKLSIVVAYHGVDGVDQFIKERPDFVIIDSSLPYLKGTEVIKYFRHIEKKETPVALMTVDSFNIDTDESNALGILKILEKPIDPDELSILIETYLRKEMPKN